MSTEATPNDSATVRFPPPLVYVAALIVGVLLHAFVKPLPLGLATGPRRILALTFVMLGLAIMFAAIRLFRRTGQNPKPWNTTPEIISTGIYRFTRNPMYLAMALLQAAAGIGRANGWIIVLVPVSLVAVYTTAIRHEEAYLERKFGDAYRRYKRSVRRWL